MFFLGIKILRGKPGDINTKGNYPLNQLSICQTRIDRGDKADQMKKATLQFL